MFAIIIFWISLCFILYVYFAYPLIIMIISFFKKKKPDKSYITPYVSFLIIAHNEEEVIGDKIRNCLELNYPEDKIKFTVVSSGSTDKTDNIVASFDSKKVALIRLDENKGKSYAINKIVPTLKGDIIVFSDSRQTL